MTGYMSWTCPVCMDIVDYSCRCPDEPPFDTYIGHGSVAEALTHAAAMRAAAGIKTGYYVNARNDAGNNFLMRGPYGSREAAEAAVIPVSREADAIDPRASFMLWGVIKMEAPELPLGRLGGAE